MTDVALALSLAQSAAQSLRAMQQADDDREVAYHRREAAQAAQGLTSVLGGDH